jgi:hypothetical protein
VLQHPILFSCQHGAITHVVHVVAGPRQGLRQQMEGYPRQDSSHNLTEFTVAGRSVCKHGC